jgi:hypothetical protein
MLLSAIQRYKDTTEYRGRVSSIERVNGWAITSLHNQTILTLSRHSNANVPPSVIATPDFFLTSVGPCSRWCPPLHVTLALQLHFRNSLPGLAISPKVRRRRPHHSPPHAPTTLHHRRQQVNTTSPYPLTNTYIPPKWILPSELAL